MLPILLAALESEEDKRFFARFYQAHHKKLYRFALSLLHSPALAEEAAQEAWMKCVQNAEQFFSLPGNKKLPWMVVVVRNTALSLLRREQRDLPLEEDWDTADPDPGDPRGIVAIIRSMPEQYRTILELKFVLEWKDKDIARYVGLSESAVSTRIARGRKLLQEALRKEGYAYE